MFDLDAYLARIGLSGRPSIAEVHLAHSITVPFENLDPHRGMPVSLALVDLERKLVAERRGGYCFEQNLLLKAALEALGAEVDLLLARVRFGAAPGVVRPRGHLVLRVRGEGATWHADVGFGLGTLLEPLTFGPGAEHEQAGWRFRVLEDRPELVLQTVAGEGWVDLYGFYPHPVPRIDVETVNWWTSTHPRSPFVTGLIVSTQAADGTRLALSDWGGLELTERTPTATSTRPLERDAVPELLAGRFGLGGFELDSGGRLVREASAAPVHRA
jgi:N-hydroxyarylamine O-acetyltransferase